MEVRRKLLRINSMLPILVTSFFLCKVKIVSVKSVYQTTD